MYLMLEQKLAVFRPIHLPSKSGGEDSPAAFHNAAWKWAHWQWSLKAAIGGGRLLNFGGA